VTLIQAGRARVIVDGTTVLDGFADPPPRGTAMFGMGSVEVAASVDLQAGTPVEVTVEFSTRPGRDGGGLRIGWEAPEPPDQLDRAVAAAAAADAVVLVVGTSGEWESEGHDRTTMDLPGRQDELVEAVLAANPATVVVVNTGSPVTMDWAPAAPTVLQAWFGGQELGPALADVLLGAGRAGRPAADDAAGAAGAQPVLRQLPGEAGHVRYGEGVLVGYRWYDARGLPVRFPFGHGGSYTTWSWARPPPRRPSSPPAGPWSCGSRSPTPAGGGAPRSCSATSRRRRPGSCARPRSWPRSPRSGWTRARRRPSSWCSTSGPSPTGRPPSPSGRSWPPGRRMCPMTRAGRDGDGPGWRVDPGRYELRIGTSSADIAHVVVVEVTSRTG
jgi:hypothetical protein